MLQKVLRQRMAALFVCVAGFLSVIPFAGIQASIQKGQSVAPKFNSVTRVPVGLGGVNPQNLAINTITNRIYSSNYSSRNVTVLDGATRAIITNIPIGGAGQGIAVNETTNRVYVANYETGMINVIDGATNAVLSSVAVGSLPYGVAVNPVTNRVFVTKPDEVSQNSVVVIDGATNSVTGTVPTQSPAGGIGVNPATNLVYASCGMTGIVVFDGTTLAVIANVSTPQSSSGVGVNPVTNRIYVGGSDGQMLVIDGSSQTVTTMVPLPFTFGNIVVNPVTNRLYLARPETAFTIFDGATNTILSTISTFSYGIAVNPNTNQVFSSARTTIIQFDGNTNAEVGRTAIGNRLASVAVHPMLGRVYLLNQATASISVLDGKTGAILATLPITGAVPVSLCVNPLTNRLYAPTNTSGTYVFDCTTNQLLPMIPSYGLVSSNMVANPVTNRLYLLDYSSRSLVVLDGASHSLIGKFTLNLGAPSGLVLDPVANRIYVQHGFVVEVVDGFSNTVVALLYPPGANSFRTIAINPKTNLIYALTTASQNAVAVFDGRSRTQVATIPIPFLPSVIEVDPENNRIYVAHSTNTFTSIDGTTNTVRETSPNISGPAGIAVDPFTSQVYVPNAGDDTLTIFDEGETNPKHPKVLFFTPNIGMAGTAVTILGKNFGTATSITLNGQPISFSVQSANQLNLVIPPGARTGQLVVTNLTGSVNAGVFTVIRQK